MGAYSATVIVVNMISLIGSGFTLYGNFLMSVFGAGLFAILFGILVVVMDMRNISIPVRYTRTVRTN